MGTVPVPYAWIAGDDATQARMITLTDGGLYALGSTTSGGSRRPVCKMRQTVAQSLANNTDVAITLDTEDVDYDNGHSTVTNTSRYTAATAGWYQVNFGVAFSGNATGHRVAELRTNGTTFLPGSIAQQPTSSAAEGSVVTGSILVFLNAGDYLELCGNQNSGGAVNTVAGAGTQSFLCVEWRSN